MYIYRQQPSQADRLAGSLTSRMGNDLSVCLVSVDRLSCVVGGNELI